MANMVTTVRKIATLTVASHIHVTEYLVFVKEGVKLGGKAPYAMKVRMYISTVSLSLNYS